MIQYEDVERDVLFNKLIVLLEHETDVNLDYVYITVSNYRAQISSYLLRRIIFWQPLKEANFSVNLSPTFRELFDLIHFIPLEDVPLYINIYPDVSSWRLELGK